MLGSYARQVLSYDRFGPMRDGYYPMISSLLCAIGRLIFGGLICRVLWTGERLLWLIGIGSVDPNQFQCKIFIHSMINDR